MNFTLKIYMDIFKCTVNWLNHLTDHELYASLGTSIFCQVDTRTWTYQMFYHVLFIVSLCISRYSESYLFYVTTSTPLNPSGRTFSTVTSLFDSLTPQSYTLVVYSPPNGAKTRKVLGSLDRPFFFNIETVGSSSTKNQPPETYSTNFRTLKHTCVQDRDSEWSTDYLIQLDLRLTT